MPSTHVPDETNKRSSLKSTKLSLKLSSQKSADQSSRSLESAGESQASGSLRAKRQRSGGKGESSVGSRSRSFSLSSAAGASSKAGTEASKGTDVVSDTSDEETLSVDEKDKKQRKKATFFSRRANATKSWYDTYKTSHAGYGPPYHIEYGGDLPHTCNEMLPDMKEVHHLLRNGANPNLGHEEDHFLTPMHFAARFGNVELLTMLHRAGGDPDLTNVLGLTPLAYTSCFQLSLEKNGKGVWQDRQVAAVKWLLEKGANPNHVDKAGFTPLAWACRSGVLPVVTALVEAGADVMQRRPKLPGTSAVCLPKADVLAVTSNPQIKKYIQAKITAILVKEEARRRRKSIIDHRRIRREEMRAMIAAKQEVRRWAVQQKLRVKEMEVLNMEFLKLDKAQLARKERKELLARLRVAPGVWKKMEGLEGHRPSWVFSTNIKSKGEARTHDVLSQAKHVRDTVLLDEHRHKILAPRWRNITGKRLLRLSHGEEVGKNPGKMKRRGGTASDARVGLSGLEEEEEEEEEEFDEEGAGGS